MSVGEASWRLAVFDIANGDGIATITLKSGVQLSGEVDRGLSESDVLFVRTKTKGWHTIDWEEIAAISGEPKPRSY
jgi:hypothetical protein